MSDRAPLLLLIASSVALLFVGLAQRRAYSYASADPTDAPDWVDTIAATLAAARDVVLPSPVADMAPSQQLLDMLKAGEGLRLARYRLGDGGWTIGYGRYYPDGGTLPPERIDQATADQWFAEDVEARGARWVRTYVAVPLLQQQFDALTSMAYNLSPKSFKTIADQVNAGQDPEDAAMRYTRPGTNLQAGLVARRGRELALYRTGTYA